MKEIQAHLKARALKASGSAEVTESSAGVIYSEGGAASSDEIFEGSALEWESKLGRFGRKAGQV